MRNGKEQRLNHKIRDGKIECLVDLRGMQHATTALELRSIIFLELRRTCLLWSVAEAVGARLSTLTRGRSGTTSARISSYEMCNKISKRRQDVGYVWRVLLAIIAFYIGGKVHHERDSVSKEKECQAGRQSVLQLMQYSAVIDYQPRREQGLNFQADWVRLQRLARRLCLLPCRDCQFPSPPSLGYPGEKSIIVLVKGCDQSRLPPIR